MEESLQGLVIMWLMGAMVSLQIPIKAPGRARGELEITYLDEELR